MKNKKRNQFLTEMLGECWQLETKGDLIYDYVHDAHVCQDCDKKVSKNERDINKDYRRGFNN